MKVCNGFSCSIESTLRAGKGPQGILSPSDSSLNSLPPYSIWFKLLLPYSDLWYPTGRSLHPTVFHSVILPGSHATYRTYLPYLPTVHTLPTAR